MHQLKKKMKSSGPTSSRPPCTVQVLILSHIERFEMAEEKTMIPARGCEKVASDLWLGVGYFSSSTTNNWLISTKLQHNSKSDDNQSSMRLYEYRPLAASPWYLLLCRSSGNSEVHLY